MSRDAHGVENIVSKLQFPSYYGLGVIFEQKDDSHDQRNNKLQQPRLRQP